MFISFIYLFSVYFQKIIFGPDFKCNIYLTDSLTSYSINKCEIKEFNDFSVTVLKYIPSNSQLLENYEISKFIFEDLNSLKIRRRKNVILYTIGGAAAGAFLGGIIGSEIGESQCPPSGDYLLGVGVMCGWEDMVHGFWGGMVVGGLAGLCVSTWMINIPLSTEKTKKRNKILLRHKY